MTEIPKKKSNPVAKVRSITASQQIYPQLRNRILSLELLPGQALSRLEVANYYGVSQTPVREAMKKLEDEGLLNVMPQHRTEVALINIAEARQAHFLRLSIEVEIARQLAGSSSALDFKSQHTLLLQASAAIEAKDMALFKSLDEQFHRSLYQLAGVEQLWHLVAERGGHIDRLRTLSLMDSQKGKAILAEHNQILKAIQAANPMAAEAATRQHLSGTLSQVETLRKSFPDFF